MKQLAGEEVADCDHLPRSNCVHCQVEGTRLAMACRCYNHLDGCGALAGITIFGYGKPALKQNVVNIE